MLPTLFNVVNNIEQVVEPESSPQSGVTMLNNIVDNIEQCGQHNIVQSCFQQPSKTRDFLPCSPVPKHFHLLMCHAMYVSQDLCPHLSTAYRSTPNIQGATGNFTYSPGANPFFFQIVRWMSNITILNASRHNVSCAFRPTRFSPILL